MVNYQNTNNNNNEELEKEFEEILASSDVAKAKNSILSRHYYLGYDDSQDLESTLNLAVWDALRNYDPKCGAPKVACCIKKMHWAAQDYLSSRNTIAISRDDYQIRKSISEFFEEHPYASIKDCADELGVKESTVLQHRSRINCVSMSKPLGGDTDDITVEDTIADESGEDEDSPYSKYLPLMKDKMKECLSLKEEDIVCSYFGIGCPKQSSTEIGKRYGVSHTAITKCKDNALRKLKDSLSALSFSFLKNIFFFTYILQQHLARIVA